MAHKSLHLLTSFFCLKCVCVRMQLCIAVDSDSFVLVKSYTPALCSWKLKALQYHLRLFLCLRKTTEFSPGLIWCLGQNNKQLYCQSSVSSVWVSVLDKCVVDSTCMQSVWSRRTSGIYRASHFLLSPVKSFKMCQCPSKFGFFMGQRQTQSRWVGQERDQSRERKQHRCKTRTPLSIVLLQPVYDLIHWFCLSVVF